MDGSENVKIAGKSDDNYLQGCCACTLVDTLQNFGETGCLIHNVRIHWRWRQQIPPKHWFADTKLQFDVSEVHNIDLSLLKGKGLPQQAEVAQGVPGRLRPQIFLTFGTARVVGHQPYAPAAFTPGEIPGTHFWGWVDLRAHGSIGNYRKNPQCHHRESIPKPSD